jgi:hypothetical protein
MSANIGMHEIAGLPILIQVKPSLKQAVLEAANQRPFLRGAGVNTQPGDSSALTIVMTFESRVDRERQRSNLEGAVATGLSGLILGAIVPWACATTHTLSAQVLRADGAQILAETVSEAENKVGTMLWCPDVTEPGAAVATKMAGSLFSKLEQSGLFTSSGKP